MEKEAKHWWMNRFENLELYADQFLLRNPAWTEKIQTQVKAEIYKLMLHEEGAFLPHQDSEKADEIFGSNGLHLVISETQTTRRIFRTLLFIIFASNGACGSLRISTRI